MEKRTSMSSPPKGEAKPERKAMKQLREKSGYENLPHSAREGFKHASELGKASGSASCMQALSLFKGGALISRFFHRAKITRTQMLAKARTAILWLFPF